MRTIINLVIKAGVLMLIHHFGFLQLKNSGTEVYGWGAFWVALVISLIFVLITWVVGLVWIASTVLTLGLMIIAYPFIGAIVLWIITSFAPEFLVIHWFWPMFLTGVAMMFIGIPKVERRYSDGSVRRF